MPSMLELRAGRARVVIDPAGGGRIERLEVDGLALLVPPEVDDRGHGAFCMAPFAGRLRHGTLVCGDGTWQFPRNAGPHAIHGMVRDRRWEVERAAANSVVMSVPLTEPWPFAGRVVQRCSLEPGALHLAMEVHSHGEAMPATCGWHPWWSRDLGRGGALEVELHADSMYARDSEGIPNGERMGIRSPPWDDCFADLGTPVAVLRWPGAAQVTIETDCPCVVVFTEAEHAVCVEPQSGPPDEVNFAPHLVEPGHPLVVTTSWRWHLDA